ncbi:MAG: chemotaxis protein CheW [Campylobacterota bacterium]|nr:chemotaxis protein CheW [Campylobacterota bacterium]
MMPNSNYTNDIQENIDYITKSHLRNVMQLAIFYTGSDKVYAVNISKIQSFLIKDDIDIVKTPSADNVVVGVINLRGEMISIINLDEWIGEKIEDDPYKIVIVCNYNNRKIGILVKDIIKIEEKNSSDLKLPSSNDPKISYVTETEVENNSHLCIVFDAEKLLYDINKDSKSEGTTIYDIDSFGKLEDVTSNKLLLVAEDSRVVIEKLDEFLTKINVRHEIYENGQLLIDRLETLDTNEIGLVVTDIEMPIRNGYQVIKFIKDDIKYSHLPIISLTSMTNQGVLDKVQQLGAIDLVNKADLNKLHEYIKEYL